MRCLCYLDLSELESVSAQSSRRLNGAGAPPGLAFALRVSVASFLNAVSDRVPQGQGWAGET